MSWHTSVTPERSSVKTFPVDLIPLFVNTWIQVTTVASMYILSYGHVAIIFYVFNTLIYGEI
jgi:hypothetical protein